VGRAADAATASRPEATHHGPLRMRKGCSLVL
jgi:hypothetical protein